MNKKLYTGYKRNDQVATDLNLWRKAQSAELPGEISQLQQVLVLTTEANQDVVISGYTHLQRAQPIIFAHLCLAYGEMPSRNEIRLRDTLTRLDVGPLGVNASVSSTCAIDRDHVLELLSDATIGMVHLSRFDEDLIFFNTGEAEFIELSDRVTSTSSLMPQKKNPMR